MNLEPNHQIIFFTADTDLFTTVKKHLKSNSQNYDLLLMKDINSFETG